MRTYNQSPHYRQVMLREIQGAVDASIVEEEDREGRFYDHQKCQELFVQKVTLNICETRREHKAVKRPSFDSL